MFNLLRMDLYRIKRSKSVYVCFGILLLMTVTAFYLLWLVLTPQGQETAVKLGMQIYVKEGYSQEGIDTLDTFRQIGLNGGAYNILFGIWVMLFVCMDYQSGFIKNIMSQHQNRWNYAGSKILAAGIVDFCYLFGNYLFILVMNRIFGNMMSFAAIHDALFYLSWAWLVTTAFAAFMILVCIWSRNVAAGAIAAVLFGSGSIVVPLSELLGMFHLGGWVEYTIYMTLSTGPDQYRSVSDLHVYLIGAGFLILYVMIAGIVLQRQDI